jgi:DNA-binding response OmpR family regulator
MATVLLIEDDSAIRHSLTLSLTQTGHHVLGFADGLAALDLGLPSSPDIVLLDLGLPDIDGSTLLSMMRAISAVPVIVVTARVAHDEMVRLLNLGADDYVTKPFSFAQLDARMRAVLRRSAPAAVTVIHIGSLFINCPTREVTLRGAPLDLRNTEFKLLLLLAQHKDEIVSSSTITQQLWNETTPETLARLDVHLSSLRSKFGESGRHPGYLQRIRGVGLRLSAPVG